MKLRDANLQVKGKNSFTNRPSCILPSFSKNASRLLLPKRLTSFMLNMAFGFVLSTVFLSSNWNLLQHITKTTKTFFFPQPVFSYVVFFDKKLIVLHHGDNTFLFCFDICIKYTLSAIILTMEKSHLMFELRCKTIFMIKISYKTMLQ